jgi:hypothetical protein
MRKERVMRKLVWAGAAFAALSANAANAADIVSRPMARAPQQTAAVAPSPPVMQQGPRGVAGARWGNLCWIDVDGGHYSGYWGQCPRSVIGPRAARAQVIR